MVAAVVVAVVLLALVAPSQRNDGPPLDTSSSSAQGTKAAVELARRLGAEVEVTSQLPVDGTDVALVFEDLIGADQTPDVLDWVSAGHTLVVADPHSSLTPPADVIQGDPFSDSQTIGRGSLRRARSRRPHRPG